MIETLLVAVMLIVASVTAYLIPLMIAVTRRVPDIGAIAVINILIGWTFIGWVIALAMALRSVNSAGPTVQFVQNLPPGGWDGLGGAQQWQAPPMMLLPPPEDAGDAAEWE